MYEKKPLLQKLGQSFLILERQKSTEKISSQLYFTLVWIFYSNHLVQKPVYINLSVDESGATISFIEADGPWNKHFVDHILRQIKFFLV